MFKIVLLFIFFYTSSIACGGGFWPEDYQFRFLHKRNFEFANITGDLTSSRVYNDLIYDYNDEIKKQNIKEWKAQFGEAFSTKQIEKFIYKNKELSKIKNEEIRDYIDFLEYQKPYISSDRWYYQKFGYKGVKLDMSKLPVVIDEALKRVENVNSRYLKLRYFFIALRLSHYNNLDNTINIYNKYKYLLKNSNSIVKEWIQGLYAGMLIKKGEVVKGVYEFTKLFGEDKYNWHLAYYNFKYIKTDKQWNKLLSMAKNKEEKIKFYTIRALNVKANVLEELKNITKIDKNSKFFDLLLFRTLLNSQEFFDIPMPYYYDSKVVKNYEPFISYLKSIKRDDMYMVDLALAYFNFYQKNIDVSKKYLNKAYKEVSGDDIHELNALKYIIYLNNLTKIDEKTENEIGTKLEKLMLQPCNKNSIHKYTFYKIKDIYKKQNNELKYYLSKNINYINVNGINLEKYNELKALENKQNKTKLEKYMINHTLKSEYVRRELKLAYTNILMNNLMFDEVLKRVKKSTKKEDKLEFNIFNNYIVGNNRVHSEKKYTFYETVKKLIDIQNSLKKNPNSTMDNYLYATALYNLSYWGNSNILTTKYRSNYYFKEKDNELKKINLSIKHFKKALQSAKNKDFRAKILYMLAKSELALYDINNSKVVNYDSTKGYETKRAYSWNSSNTYENYIIKGYGKFFDDLKNKYQDTNYYKELLKECGYLNYYYDTVEDIKRVNTQIKNSSNKIELLKSIESDTKLKRKSDLNRYNQIYFYNLFKNIKLSKSNVTYYNNIAYYLNKKRKNDEAIYILEKIVNKYPNRVVALYNLGDVYYDIYDMDMARKYYKKYVALMKKLKKENNIPKKVLSRVQSW
ncbi:hypothetical protein CRU98_05580 [Arcobacter sp. CECT 8986]|uniref:tetratricopeptide repeat protein n=1 Tax=Arcobacter sp. CECT 8986 TaxID=2044507 RepID=UPI001009FE99|nr:tetratricopeptide repeat protein [Arcobacter sp. CECT 8986]RXJ99498.1 hypothetical protein CRU98_05580 [Arcobacter sp. CECT 8986]